LIFISFQLDALSSAGCEWIWTDTASGRLARRPEWDKCLDYLRAGDELVVTSLSRMARSVRHLTEIAALLTDRGVDLVVLKETGKNRVRQHSPGEPVRCGV
jgi:DNA invertase Pin-like site-specific DNA recombinase